MKVIHKKYTNIITIWQNLKNEKNYKLIKFTKSQNFRMYLMI